MTLQTDPHGHAAGSIDALVPAEMARKAEDVGVRRARTDTASLFILAVLAGAFIALGAIFALTVTDGAATVTTSDGVAATVTLPFGVTRLAGGIAFSLGLILVVIAGAELFTGNILLVIAWASHRVSTLSVGRNWVIVYFGNLVGAIGIAGLAFASGWYKGGSGAIGVVALTTAQGKVQHSFLEALVAGILCNALVCLAVWLTYSARTVTDKVFAIVPPVAAFVAAGFEHSVANMFFLPIAMLIRAFAPPEFWASAGVRATDYERITFGAMISNLVPVTLGNIIGGAVMVAGVYWFVYLRKSPDGTPARSPFRRTRSPFGPRGPLRIDLDDVRPSVADAEAQPLLT